MTEGARRSADAFRAAPTLPDGVGAGSHRRAARAWAVEHLPRLWVRHRRLIIGIGLFLLFDLVALIAATTMGTHF